MRHRVTLERPHPGEPDDFGQVPEQWIAVRDVMAQVEPVTARETIEGPRQVGQITHTVRLRWLPGLAIQPSWRVRFGASGGASGGRVLNIVTVINVGELNRELELVCQEDLS